MFAEIALSDEVLRHLRPVEYRGDSPLKGRVFTIPEWDRWTMEQRVAFLRLFTEDKARDPMIARKAIRIVREAHVPLRDHLGEWQALLRWMQRNVRFTAEPKERICSPQYTLTERHGDCDDGSIALAALGYALRLQFRFVLLGKSDRGKRVRWIEGEGPCPKDVNWHHIYCLLGDHPFRPTRWKFGEFTLDVPLGFDPYTDRVPKNRADLSGGDEGSAYLFRRPAEIGVAPDSAGVRAGVRAHLAKVNWPTVTATVIGGVLSALAVRWLLGGARRR